MEAIAKAGTDAGEGAELDRLNDLIELAREIRISIEGTPPSFLLPPVVRAALPQVIKLADGLAAMADQVKTLHVNQRGILYRLSMLEGTAGVNEFAAELVRNAGLETAARG